MYSLNVISNKPHLFNGIVSSLAPERVCYFDGSGYPSFSALVNQCTAASGSEYVVIMSDKVRPTASHVEQAVGLLRRGYGFVGLYRFAFFAFSKELFRTIGGLDEGYIGGGFEDDDFYIRLVEADIAMWVTHDVPYTAAPSGWNPERSRLHHEKKWLIDIYAGKIIRRLPEVEIQIDLGPRQPVKWLQHKHHSYTNLSQVAQYCHCTIEEDFSAEHI